LDNLTLRPAVQADEKNIKALIHEVGINPMDLHWEHFVVVVTPENELAGCGQIKTHRDGSPELASIAVQEKFRGQGIARRVIEHLSASHPATLYLTCLSDLEPFYEKFGFRALKYEEMPKFFQRLSKLANVMMVFIPDQRMSVMMREAPDK
jgi:N-acetylglutamate synthase-like GNAT family acetyltransferase